MMFRNREEAGGLLARALAEYEGHPNVIVLGLPRGGDPMAHRCRLSERSHTGASGIGLESAL
jgi:predicted phosphoribosyltransferase